MNEDGRELADQYGAALNDYLAEPSEAGRMRGYDLGRRALSGEAGVAELAGAHGAALAAALAQADGPAEQARLMRVAAEFQGEALAPFEMMLRGYQEANASLQQLNESLEQRVRERTAALQESEEQLQQHADQLAEAGRRKDEFLAMLAHELRNPLAPIRNALKIMRLPQADAAATTKARDVIERQVHHLVRLVDDLMDVSRITRGKIELRKERLDLAVVVPGALEISRPHVEAARHELTVALPAGPLYVHADATRLTQVVANLLNNATKYTLPGGRIWLTIESESSASPSSPGGNPGSLAVVRVRDNGIGIPTDMLPRIFDLFVQVASSLEHSEGGMGIGLTLVRGLVEMHGGRVTAYSDGPGKGSEFVVHLPLDPEG